MMQYIFFQINRVLNVPVFLLNFILLFLNIIFGAHNGHAQISIRRCESSGIADISLVVNALVYVDPDTGGSITSLGGMQVLRGGYYRIAMKVDYNSGDKQRNESFFLFITTANGDTITPVDADAGPYKVVQDVAGPGQRVWQDAGSFWLPAGANEIMMCHYAKIAMQYPDFLDGPIDGEESVYVDSIRIIYEPIVDGAVKLEAFTKDSVAIENMRYGLLSPGDSVVYKIAIGNMEQDSLYGAIVTTTLTGSFIAATDFSPVPDSISDNILFWRLPPIAGRDKRLISFQAQLAGAMPAGFTRLPAKVELYTPCDLDLSNNFSQVDIYAYADSSQSDTGRVEARFVDVGVRLTANLDSRQVSDSGDAIYVAQADSFVAFQIRLQNFEADTANDVRVANFFSPPVHIESMSLVPITPENDTLQWRLPAIAPGSSVFITYRARMPHVDAGENLHFANTVRVLAENDTVSSNNIDQILVIVRKIDKDSTDKELILADVAVKQFAVTDSFLVHGRDTLHFARAGETYRRTLVITNASDTVASNVALYSFYSPFVRPHSFSVEPNRQNATSFSWEIPVLQAGEIVRIGFKETVLSELSPDIQMLVNETRITAENEDPLLLANNVAKDTIYTYSATGVFPVAVQPGIEASPKVADIGQLISLQVRFPREPASWDVWAYFADGNIDSTFADQEIALHGDPEIDVWLRLPEIFTNTRLYTDARQERITFEIRVVDRDGLFAKNTADVQVQSANAFTLDRNVFEPDLRALEIRFKLNSNRTARLDVYNLIGQHITRLAEQPYDAGWHSQRWDGLTDSGEKVVSGVYLITIRSGDFNAWKRCIIVR